MSHTHKHTHTLYTETDLQTYLSYIFNFLSGHYAIIIQLILLLKHLES